MHFRTGLGFAVLCLTLLAGPSQAGLADGAAAHKCKDYAAALKEFRPLAEQGNADGRFNLGLMYANGQGVPQDYTMAPTWYLTSADHGYARAQYHLGVFYAHGVLVPKNLVIAYALYNAAAANDPSVLTRELVKPRNLIEAVKGYSRRSP